MRCIVQPRVGRLRRCGAGQGLISTITGSWDGNYATVEKMLEAGAEVNQPNADGKTPYQLAQIRGDKLTMGLLQRYGATG